jgi:hypothetical protein
LFLKQSMFRAFSLNGNIYIIRLCHLPTLSETIKIENHRGDKFQVPTNNVKDFLRQIINTLNLNINLQKPNGDKKTTNELGKEIMSVL